MSWSQQRLGTCYWKVAGLIPLCLHDEETEPQTAPDVLVGILHVCLPGPEVSASVYVGTNYLTSKFI